MHRESRADRWDIGGGEHLEAIPGLGVEGHSLQEERGAWMGTPVSRWLPDFLPAPLLIPEHGYSLRDVQHLVSRDLVPSKLVMGIAICLPIPECLREPPRVSRV